MCGVYWLLIAFELGCLSSLNCIFIVDALCVYVVIRETRKPNEEHVKGAMKVQYNFSTEKLVFGTQSDSIPAPKDFFFLSENN